MKSKEFLRENLVDIAMELEKQYNLSAFDIHFALKVREDCQPFLQQCGGDPFMLYRGVHASSFTIDKDTRLTDRKPLNMDNLLHQKINIYLDDHYGHPYRNALFVSGDMHNADYGENTYHVFPKGDFDFLWAENPMYDDMYTAWNKYRNSTELPMPDYVLIQQDDIADKFLKNANFHTTDLPRASDEEQSREIMIWCEGYYGIKSDYEYYDELTEIMLK